MPDPTAEIIRAVHLTRHGRHFPDCNCTAYRRHVTINGTEYEADGYCTVDEWRWNQAINRLLDTIESLSAVSTAKHRIKENQ
jgi:hypothetical protein